MAATIEIKYYNSFWLKKLASITAVNYLNPSETDANTAKSTGLGVSGTNTVQISNANAASVGIGQILTYSISSVPYIHTIIYKDVGVTDTILTLSNNITGPNIAVDSTILTFGKIINNAWLPSAYSASNDKDWHIEETRIRGAKGAKETRIRGEEGAKETRIRSEKGAQETRIRSENGDKGS